MILNKSKILVLSPSEGVAETGAGGLISSTVDAGGFVSVVTVCIGGSYKLQEHIEAMEFLKPTKHSLLMFKDSYLALSAPNKDKVVGDLEELIDINEIDTLILPPTIFQLDYKYVYEWGFEVANKLKDKIKNVLVYEIPQVMTDETGSIYFDITKKMNVKILTAGNYKDLPIKPIETMAKIRGQQSGVPFAERFTVIRMMGNIA